jgi:hypothetical protein
VRDIWSSLQSVTYNSTLTKISRYCGPVWDISTFKSSFHSILHAERIARHFLSSQDVTYYSILTKINRYFGAVWDTLTFMCSFHSILHAERSVRYFEQLAKCHVLLHFDEN